MEDPKVFFADTTARRAQLMAATERLKGSITENVESIKEDATEVGKTVAFVGGAALAVYLVANALLPKSAEYRYAEKYGEPDDTDVDEEGTRLLSKRRAKKIKEETKQTSATAGLIGGLLTTVLTNLAREQLTGFISRIKANNAINPTAKPTEYHEQATTEPVDPTA